MTHMDGDLIFQRAVGHPEIEGSGRWEDASECFMCNRYSKVTIEMDELEEIIDQDFGNLMQLTSILNERD